MVIQLGSGTLSENREVGIHRLSETVCEEHLCFLALNIPRDYFLKYLDQNWLLVVKSCLTTKEVSDTKSKELSLKFT